MAWRRSLREFAQAWVRYLAVAALVVLGIGVVLALMITATASTTSLREAARASELADGEFTTVAPLSAAQVRTVAALGVRLQEAPTLDLPREGAAGTLRVFPRSDGLNRPVLDRGRAPTRTGEAMVEKLHAEATGIVLGGRVVVGGRTFTVVGIGVLPNYSYPLARLSDTSANPGSFGLLVVTAGDFASLRGAHPDRVVPTYSYRLGPVGEERLRRTLLEFTVAPDAVDNRLLRDGLRRAERAGAPVAYPLLESFLPASANLRITSALDDATLNLRVAGGAGVLVMVLVGYVLAAFSTDRIAREGPTIGALYALGFTRGEVTRQYLLLPVTLSVAAAGLGALLGCAWAPSMTASERFYSTPALSYVPPWPLVAGAVLLPAALVAAVNLLVLDRALAATPLELLRPVPRAGSIAHVRLPRLPFAAAFRLRQLLRSWAGYATLTAGLGLAITLLVFGLGMRDSMTTYLDSLARDLRYEYVYSLRFADLDVVPAGAHPGIALPMTMLERGTSRSEVTLLGIDEGNPYFPVPVAGLGLHEVVVSDGVASRFGLGAGDRLVLRERPGNLSWEFTVTAVVPYAEGLYVFTSRANAQELVDPAVLTLTSWLSSDGWLAAPGRTRTTARIGHGSYYNVLFSARPLDLPADRLLGSSSRSEVLAAVHPLTTMMGNLIATIAGSAVAIFVIVLYVLIRLIVGRQRYSLALMKAFGYSEREVSRLYLGNYFWLVALVLAVGVPAGAVGLRPLWAAMLGNTSFGIPFVVPPATIAAIVGIGLASYVVVRALATRDTRAVGVVEVMKLRE